MKTEISNLFEGHVKASRIDIALRLLERDGRAEMFKQQTGGRPTERWRKKLNKRKNPGVAS